MVLENNSSLASTGYLSMVPENNSSFTGTVAANPSISNHWMDSINGSGCFLVMRFKISKLVHYIVLVIGTCMSTIHVDFFNF